MGQLCSCARSQDKRGRKWVNNTILSRNPSANSNCYTLNNVGVRHSPDGLLRCTLHSPDGATVEARSLNVDCRPRSQQSSLEESGIYSKNSTSSDGNSTTSYGGFNPASTQGNTPAGQSETALRENPADARKLFPPRPILEKSSSDSDVIVTSSTDAVDRDLKVACSVQARDPAAFIAGNDVTVKVTRPEADQLETQAQKVRSVLQRTVELLAAEVDSASIAEYLQRSRPDRELTSADWTECCNPATAQDLFWDIITGQNPDDYYAFCEVIGSKTHLHHLVDLLQTLDAVIALIAPDSDPEEEDDEDDDDDLDLNGLGYCTHCLGSEPSDFDLDLVFCYRELVATPSVAGRDERCSLQIDSSNLSLAGGSYLPSITSDELGQPNVPMLSLTLINHCLCRRRKRTLLRGLLEGPSCIRELSLVKSHIGEEELANVLHTIKDNSSLARLDLRLSSFGNEAAGRLGQSLRHNGTLRVLNVASTGLSDIGCTRLMAGIARNRSLAELDIGFNDIRDTGCHAVAEALARSNPLRKVRMRDNGITCYGACALFQSLARNCRLCFLDISSNGIGNDSLRHLSEALISNRTLRELNLENCRISADGCVALARALRANTALRCIQLSLNPITDAGLEAIADGLRYNHAVEMLSVNMCNIGNVGFLRLLDALRFNFTLKTAKLCYNQIGAGALRLDYDVTSGQEVTSLSPSLDEIFVRLYEVLHNNEKLKILLWGNDLERIRGSSGSFGTGGCLRERVPSFYKSPPRTPLFNLYRQDVLVSV